MLVTLLVVAAFLAGGYYESTYSLLAAGVWLTLAAAGALVPLRRPSAAVLCLAGLAALTALSALWGQPGAALRTAPLPALYAGALYAAQLAGGERLLRAAWLASLAAVCAGLAARAADAVPSGGGLHSSRLAWPLTYSNGLGLLAVTCALLGSALPHKRPRAAAAATALAGAAAYLTFSRSALLAGAAAALLLLALRPTSARGLAAALTGIAAAALLDLAAGTKGPVLLAALALGALAAAALPAFRVRIPPRALLAFAVALAALAAVFAQPLAARFAAPAPDERDARRLLDVSGHGRVELWRATWHEGVAHPIQGGGAGTWPREAIARTGSLAVPANAHSLYLETFAELGLAGLALLAAFIGLVALAGVRARGQPWAPAALAAFAVWALHAGVDWDWQLPAATLPALLAAGSLLSSGRRAGLAVAVAALAIGVAAGLHGIGAAALEEGRTALAARLLPWDARPDAALAAATGSRAAFARACRIDPGEPALLREDPSLGRCAARRAG